MLRGHGWEAVEGHEARLRYLCRLVLEVEWGPLGHSRVVDRALAHLTHRVIEAPLGILPRILLGRSLYGLFELLQVVEVI